MEKFHKGAKVYFVSPDEPLHYRKGYITEKVVMSHKEKFPGGNIHNIGRIFLAVTLNRTPAPSDCRYLMEYTIYDDDIVPGKFWLSEFPKSVTKFKNLKEVAVSHRNKVDFCIRWYVYLRSRLQFIEDHDCPKNSASQLRDMLKSMDYCLKVIQKSK